MENSDKVYKYRKPFGKMSKKWLRRVITRNTNRELLSKLSIPSCSNESDESRKEQINNYDNSENFEQTTQPMPSSIQYSCPFSSQLSLQSPAELSSTIQQHKISIRPIKKNSLAKELTNWAITGCISNRNFNKLLGILKSGFSPSEFQNLPCDCRTLLKTEKLDTVSITEKGHYYHFGLVNGVQYILQKNKIILPDCINIVKIDINIDGLPLTKSSKSQFWPVLGSINNLGCDAPFVIGVYHSFSKPATANELLDSFITEYAEVKLSKFSYRGSLHELKIDKFIVDIPAKTFILCVKSHNAYFGCTKCTTEGTFINRRMSFPDLRAKLSTDEDFRNKVYDGYHESDSPLLNLDIDLVKQIPLDYMHLVCLGVMKKLLIFWTRGNISVRLHKTDLNKVDLHLKNLKKHISACDFSRLPRTLDEVDRWKATEYRQFLLYTGPVVLQNRLKHSHYMHFLSLHCAIRILATPQVCVQYNFFAKTLLQYFIEKFALLYGNEYISHNVHNLIHLNEDVLNYGPLDNFAAFKFENYMYDIKKMLKTSRNPLQQFVNRIHERRRYQHATPDTVTCAKKYVLEKDIISIYPEAMLDNKMKFVVVEYVFKGTMFVSAAPKKWVNGTRCAWPKKDRDIRKAIKECHVPSEDWTILEDVKILGEYMTFKDANFYEWKFSKTEDESEGLDNETTSRPKRKVKPSQKYRDNSVSPPPHIKTTCRKQRTRSSSSEHETLISSPEVDTILVRQSRTPRACSNNSANKNIECLTPKSRHNTPTSEPKLNRLIHYEDERRGEEASSTLKLSSNSQSFDEVIMNAPIIIEEINETEVFNDVPVETHLSPNDHGNNKALRKLPLTDSTKILEAFLEIKEYLQVIDTRLRNLEDAVNSKFFVPQQKTKNEIAEVIPVKTLEELEVLENKLSDETNEEKLVRVLQYIGGTDSKSCIVRCLERLFTNQCAMLCSWTGKKNNYKLKDLKMIKILKDCVRLSHPTTKDDFFEKTVMNWLQFAKVRHDRGKL